MIVAVDGKAVSDADDVVDAVAAKKPGDSVEIEYYRGDDKRTATVKLGDRPAQLELAEPAGRSPTTAAACPSSCRSARLRPLRA